MDLARCFLGGCIHSPLSCRSWLAAWSSWKLRAELLLLVPSVAPVVGSVVLPVLGAVPDGMMVLFSGTGPLSEVEHQVSVGVGTLAGSTIMLLTIPWFLAVLAGRVDLSPSGTPMYKRPANKGPNDPWEKCTDESWTIFNNFSLLKTGVGVGESVRYNAKLMLRTLGGYFVIQIPAMLVDQATPKGRNIINLCSGAGFLICFVGFVDYLYRMWKDSQDGDSGVHDDIADKTIQAIRDGKLTLRGAMAKFQEEFAPGAGGLDAVLLGVQQKVTEVGQERLNEVRRMCKILHPFFQYYDTDNSKTIDFEEFRMILENLRLNLTRDEQLQKFVNADVDNNGAITFEEFVACLISLALDSRNQFKKTESRADCAGRRRSMVGIDQYIKDLDEREQREEEEDNEVEEEDMPDEFADLDPREQQRRIKWRAAIKTTAGTLLVLVFSDPAVDLLAEIGVRLNLSPFYVAFVLAPLASNAAELVAAMQMASRRTMKHQQVAFSVLEGAACMNNTYCLGTLLGIIWIRGLPWTFTAETISIIIIELCMAVIVYSRKVQTMLSGCFVLLLYPLSLLIVGGLESIGFD